MTPFTKVTIFALAGSAILAAFKINWSEFSHAKMVSTPKNYVKREAQTSSGLERSNSHHPMNFILQEVKEVPWDDKIHGNFNTEEDNKNYTKYLYPQTEFVPLNELDRKYITSGYKSINVYVQGETIPPGYDPELYFDGQVLLKAATSDKLARRPFDPKTCSAVNHDPNFNPFSARSFVEKEEKVKGGNGGGNGGSVAIPSIPHKPIGCCNGKTFGEGKKCCCRRKAYVTSDEFCCAIDGCRAFQTYARTEDSMEACRAAGGIVVRDQNYGYDGKTAGQWADAPIEEFTDMLERQVSDIPEAGRQFIRDNRDRKIKKMYQWEDDLEAGNDLTLNGVKIEYQKDEAKNEAAFRNGMSNFIRRISTPFHERVSPIEIEEDEKEAPRKSGKWGAEKQKRRQNFKARQEKLNKANPVTTPKRPEKTVESPIQFSFDSDFDSFESEKPKDNSLDDSLSEWESSVMENSEEFASLFSE